MIEINNCVIYADIYDLEEIMLPIFYSYLLIFFYEPKKVKTSMEDGDIQLGWHLQRP